MKLHKKLIIDKNVIWTTLKLYNGDYSKLVELHEILGKKKQNHDNPTELSFF